ncbi:MAG TPA: hypothetical protein PKA20_14040 [Burkholderiaceae bacterium]|nr:hypothetical protein [Burkholderiaceae bacterium]
MTRIIAGRFQLQDEAREAVRRLVESGFPEDRVTTFFVNPPGRHATYPIGGDRDVSPGAEHAAPASGAGAVLGGGLGVAVGLAALPVLGPVGVAAGAGVGAYVGSLHGALSGMDESDKSNRPHSADDGGRRPDDPVVPNSVDVVDPAQDVQKLTRPSGMLVAVAAPEPTQSDRAVDLLRELGAVDIEASDGTISNGDWVDFDPLQPVRLIH